MKVLSPNVWSDAKTRVFPTNPPWKGKGRQNGLGGGGGGDEIAWRKHHLTDHYALFKPQPVRNQPAPHPEALGAQTMLPVQAHPKWPQQQNDCGEKGWV